MQTLDDREARIRNSFKRLEDEFGTIEKEAIINLLTVRDKTTYKKQIFIVKISKTKGTMKLSMNEAEDLVGRVKADEEGKYLTDHFVKILCAT